MQEPQLPAEKPNISSGADEELATELSEEDMEGLAGGWVEPKPGKGGGGGGV